MSNNEHLFIKALKGLPVDRPPVWMMRQAGRYLPEYMALRKKYDFFTRVETPELASEITIQPIDIVGTDAAILFSDILTVPKAMGLPVDLVPGRGPVFSKTIATDADILALDVDRAADKLQHVYDAVKLTKSALNNRVPLIGFAGAPWTILCYMVEGHGSKTFSKAKAFCFSNPTGADKLLDSITTVTIKYLQRQVEAGADVIQLFDSWAGLLSYDDYNLFGKKHLLRIVDEISPLVPVIIFAKGSWHSLEDFANSNCSAIGIDYIMSPEYARSTVKERKTLQGNFDPARLLMPIPQIIRETKEMINRFGKQRYIVNLGHGITPDVPVDHAKAFIDTVKNYSLEYEVI